MQLGLVFETKSAEGEVMMIDDVVCYADLMLKSVSQFIARSSAR